MIFFSHVFDIANELLNVTRSGWWMNGKALTILYSRSFVGIFFGLWLTKHYKILSTDSDVRMFLDVEDEKPKVTY